MEKELLNILLIEDNLGDARLIQEMLKEVDTFKFNLEIIDNLSEGLKSIEKGFYSVILLDLKLPDSYGFETLVNMREKAKEIPIIVLTGMIDEQLAIKAVKEGAQDYLIKGQVDEKLLIRSIYHAIDRHKMLLALEESEEKLRKLNEKLEERVEKLAKELTKKEKLVYLGVIAGSMGHELRNPLAAIKNNIYYLSMILENPTENLSETLKYINEDIERMNKIISDLLDYSRLKPLERRSVNVKKFIERLLLRLNIPENIAIDKNFQENISKIFVDGLRFEQILTNIIINAFEAMENGGKLTIETSQANDDIEIQIKDTGCGIESNNLEKIFEPFYTTKAKGIGLGLGIAKRLIEAHNGNISVQSQIGQGTIFKLKFPLIKKNKNKEGK